MPVADDFFGPGTIDSDEWRDKPFRHRYVHGHFAGTDTRFVFWLLPERDYQGRFLQFLQGGMGGSEHQGQLTGQPWLARANGAYYVESNQGHIGNDLGGLKGDNTILAYRASAATAQFGRDLARAMYGTEPRHGYVYGGSGGGLRSLECLEARPQVWDAAVPFMINRNGLYFFNWSIAAWAGNVLGARLPDFIDATAPGGRDNPFTVVDTDAQRQALAALYRAGFCRGAEAQLGPNPLWILGLDLLQGYDRAYFSDFWSEPGYEGADGDPSLAALLIEETVVVERVLTGAELIAAVGADTLGAALLGGLDPEGPAAIRVKARRSSVSFLGATLHPTDGAAAGRSMRCSHDLDGLLLARFDVQGFRGVRPGDTIRVENRDLIAFCFYHRHLVSERYPEMRQFFVDGKPMYRQRERSLDRVPVPKGRFEGRMILVQNGADRECWPNCAEPYVRDVRAHYGAGVDDKFRIYWVENAPHVPPLDPAGLTALVNYAGVYQQAVGDVVRWVEQGVPPPPSTAYRIDDESARLVLPATATERLGLQPTVRALANGAARTDVRVGEKVDFEAVAIAPPGAGALVEVAWDFDGRGTWPVTTSLDTAPTHHVNRVSFAYTVPGTYFASARVTLHRDGDGAARLGRITNLARVRVCVR